MPLQRISEGNKIEEMSGKTEAIEATVVMTVLF